jgi:DNA-binding transcriptional ArsR family regulator
MLHNKYLEIMNEFLKGYFREIYGRELIGKVSLSQKNISNTLSELEGEGILKSTFKGNRRYYHINFDNSLIKEYILFFEGYSKILFLEKNPILIDFFSKLSGKIICVFGSYAKGKNKKDSDIDLLVIGGDSLEISNLGKNYGLKVQIFDISLNDFKKGIKDNLILKECLGNHIIIKGNDLFLEEVLKWKD